MPSLLFKYLLYFELVNSLLVILLTLISLPPIGIPSVNFSDIIFLTSCTHFYFGTPLSISSSITATGSLSVVYDIL